LKNFFKVVGSILLYLAIYSIAQIIPAIVLIFIQGIKSGFESTKNGGVESVPDLAEVCTAFLSKNMSIIILGGIVLASLTYYLIFKINKTSPKDYIMIKSIDVKKIISIAIFGVSLSVTTTYIWTLISSIESLKTVFNDYDELASVIFGGNSIMLTFLTVGLIVPIFEEILFRGLIFSELRKNTNQKLALIFQAIVFGIYHMDIVQGVNAFFVGFFMGWLYLRYKSILAPIILHMSINIMAVASNNAYINKLLENNGFVLFITSIILSIMMFFMLFVKKGKNEKLISVT